VSCLPCVADESTDSAVAAATHRVFSDTMRGSDCAHFDSRMSSIVGYHLSQIDEGTGHPSEEGTVERDMEYVNRDDAAQLTAILFERMAVLHASYARAIVDELGEEKGRRLILNAIREYGKKVGAQVREKAEARGEDDSPENYRGDLPAYGTHDRLETVEVDGESRLRAYGCGMWKTWEALGEEELGRLYCNTDVAKYMGFNPCYKQIHTKALFLGDDCCELVVRPTSEQEQVDFAKKDADWSYLDRDE